MMMMTLVDDAMRGGILDHSSERVMFPARGSMTRGGASKRGATSGQAYRRQENRDMLSQQLSQQSLTAKYRTSFVDDLIVSYRY